MSAKEKPVEDMHDAQPPEQPTPEQPAPEQQPTPEQPADDAANAASIKHTLIAVDPKNPQAAAEALFAWIQQQRAAAGELDASDDSETE